MALSSVMERPILPPFDMPTQLSSTFDINSTSSLIFPAAMSLQNLACLSDLPSHLTLFLTHRLPTISFPPNFPIYRAARSAFLLFMYVVILLYQVKPTAPLYNKSQRRPLQRKIANAMLAIHVTAGFTEMLRWRWLSLFNSTISSSGSVTIGPVPNAIDFFLALLQIITSLRMSKYMRRGQPLMTRPTFQGGSVFRLILSGGALWIGGETGARWHAGSVATLNGFLWVRLGVHRLGPLCVGRWGDKARMNEVYNLATFMGTVVAVSDVNIPHATKIYIAMVIAVAAINRWVTAEFGRKDNNPLKRLLLHSLTTIGFAELETINRVAPIMTSGARIDEYVEEKLKVFLPESGLPQMNPDTPNEALTVDVLTSNQLITKM